MTQGVRRNAGRDTCDPGVQLDTVPEGLAGHLLAALARKKHITGPTCQQLISSIPLVTLQPVQRFFAERNQTLLVALAEGSQHALAHAHLLQGQTDQLGDPQAAGIEHLEHCPIPQPKRITRIRRRQQGLHVRFGQCLG